jgi:ribonuclease T2
MATLRKELAWRFGVLSGSRRAKTASLALILSGTLAALFGQFHLGSRTAPAPVSGQFDYYVLSLSWAPEFCAQPGEAGANPIVNNPRECASGRGIAFVVHGLWPESREGKSPESCGPAKTVSKRLVNDLLPYMLSPGLIQHEWATHGTCTGLMQDDYFTKVLLARSAVQIPVQITSITGTETESPSQIEEQFEGSNPVFPPGAFRTACRSGAFTEIRACFNKGLKARACTASAGECTSPTLTIRPPR